MQNADFSINRGIVQIRFDAAIHGEFSFSECYEAQFLEYVQGENELSFVESQRSAGEREFFRGFPAQRIDLPPKRREDFQKAFPPRIQARKHFIAADFPIDVYFSALQRGDIEIGWGIEEDKIAKPAYIRVGGRRNDEIVGEILEEG